MKSSIELACPRSKRTGGFWAVRVWSLKTHICIQRLHHFRAEVNLQRVFPRRETRREGSACSHSHHVLVFIMFKIEKWLKFETCSKFEKMLKFGVQSDRKMIEISSNLESWHVLVANAGSAASWSGRYLAQHLCSSTEKREIVIWRFSYESHVQKMVHDKNIESAWTCRKQIFWSISISFLDSLWKVLSN